MDTVLMLHPQLLFYKVPLYDLFGLRLQKESLSLEVWATRTQREAPAPKAFRLVNGGLGWRSFSRRLERGDIEVVVNILFRREPSLLFYAMIPRLCRAAGAAAVYYGHGLNLERMPSVMERWVSNTLLWGYDSIILYSAKEAAHLWRVNRRKVWVAWNTLMLEGRRERYGGRREWVRRQRGWEGRTVILFCGRIQERKKLEVLLEYAQVMPEGGWIVVVGPNGDDSLQRKLTGRGEYLGPLYDERAVSEVFAAADIFCVPGTLGLGVVESLYWGLPVFTMSGKHGPEIVYVESGKNGVIAATRRELYAALSRAVMDGAWVQRLRAEAEATYGRACAPERMVSGFVGGVLAAAAKVRRERGLGS